MGFWDENRFVVTGGPGFLGSKVVQKLRERGASAVVMTRATAKVRDD